MDKKSVVPLTEAEIKKDFEWVWKFQNWRDNSETKTFSVFKK